MIAKEITHEWLEEEITSRIERPIELEGWLDRHIPFIVGPSISYFEPAAGHPNCMVTIYGTNFAADREDNEVKIGGQAAQVLSASHTELRVLTSRLVEDGPEVVTVGGNSAVGPHDFRVLGYPSPGSEEDGPPIAYTGTAPNPSAGDVDPIGQRLRVGKMPCTIIGTLASKGEVL